MAKRNKQIDAEVIACASAVCQLELLLKSTSFQNLQYQRY